MYYVNKQRGTHSLSLLYLTIELCEWCYHHHIFLSSHSHLYRRKLFSRSLKSTPYSDTRMDFRQSNSPEHLLSMGTHIHRPICDKSKHHMSKILLSSRQWPQITGRCLHDRLEGRTVIHVPPNSCDSENSHPDQTMSSKYHNHSSMVATTAMVHAHKIDGDRHISPTIDTEPVISEQWISPSSQHSIPESDGIEDTPTFKDILNRAQKT